METTTDDWLAVPSAELVSRFAADDRCRALAQSAPASIDLLAALVENQQFVSAVDLLANWLPTEHGVWWGCLCNWDLQRQNESPQLLSTMQLIITWLHSPENENRKKLQQVDQWFPNGHQLNLLAKAALYSGGSLASDEFDVVAPPKHLSAIMLSTSIKLVAAKSPATQLENRYQQILHLGKEVLMGHNHWMVAD